MSADSGPTADSRSVQQMHTVLELSSHEGHDETGLLGPPKCHMVYAASPIKRKSLFPPLFPPLFLGWACDSLSLTEYGSNDTVQVLSLEFKRLGPCS